MLTQNTVDWRSRISLRFLAPFLGLILSKLFEMHKLNSLVFLVVQFRDRKIAKLLKEWS